MNCLSQKVKRSRPLLGTYVSIELQGLQEENILNQWITSGFESIAQVDSLMSFHRLDSDLSRLNQAKPDEWVKLHPDTIVVLQICRELFIFSDGIFDIRCGQILVDQGILPKHINNHKTKIKISDQHVPFEIDGNNVRKSDSWIFDLGGIAKGYAVDQAVAKIKNLSSDFQLSGVINAGGDLYAWGEKNVPIAAQILNGTNKWLKPFKISETAVATSTVRIQSLSENLSKAAHIKMPEGKTYQDIKTITVLAPRCVWADALTKIVLLGSPDQAARCLSFYEAKAIIFDSDGKVEMVIE